MTFVRHAMTTLGFAMTVLMLSLILSHPIANVAAPAVEASDEASRTVRAPE